MAAEKAAIRKGVATKLAWRNTTLTPGLLARSAVAFLMAAAAVQTVLYLDAWLGDLGAVLWICACFFFPFLMGIAWGEGAEGNTGRAGGALLGGAIALVPLAAFIATGWPRPLNETVAATEMLPVIFTLLGMAQGAVSAPVGARARRPRAGGPSPTQ